MPDALTVKNEASTVKKLLLNLKPEIEMFLRYYRRADPNPKSSNYHATQLPEINPATSLEKQIVFRYKCVWFKCQHCLCAVRNDVLERRKKL